MAPHGVPDAPWYDKGLSFQCRRCGQCCRGPGGYVWVTLREAATLASAIGLDADAFGKRYLRQTSHGLALVDGAGGHCPFLAGNGCAVYDARPVQCRTWPWWSEVIASPESWKAEETRCPGIGKGDVVSAEDIYRRVNQKFGEGRAG